MSGDWYARPVFFVRDAERAAEFYVDRLGFAVAWRHAHEGRTLVAQVDRAGCEVILCEAPEKAGQGRVFVSLEADLLAAVRAELEARGAPVRDGWWGYDLMAVDDPDGNELYFPYPAAEAGQ